MRERTPDGGAGDLARVGPAGPKPVCRSRATAIRISGQMRFAVLIGRQRIGRTQGFAVGSTRGGAIDEKGAECFRHPSDDFQPSSVSQAPGLLLGSLRSGAARA